MKYLESLDYLQLPSVRYDNKARLPIASGIYFVIDDSNEILYIGQAINIKTRWYYHHRKHEFKGREDIRIAWLDIDRDHLRKAESILIDIYQPCLNKRKESEEQDVSILKFMQEKHLGLYNDISEIV